ADAGSAVPGPHRRHPRRVAAQGRRLRRPDPRRVRRAGELGGTGGQPPVPPPNGRHAARAGLGEPRALRGQGPATTQVKRRGRAQPASLALSRSSYFRTLPLALRGRAPTTSTLRGTL